MVSLKGWQYNCQDTKKRCLLLFCPVWRKGDVCLVEVLSSITWSFATRGNNTPQDRGNSQTKTALILSLQNIRICHIRATHHFLLHKSPESQYPRPCPNTNHSPCTKYKPLSHNTTKHHLDKGKGIRALLQPTV